jgi:hypothetical protein
VLEAYPRIKRARLKNKQQTEADCSYAAGTDDETNTDTSQTDCAIESHGSNSFLSFVDTQHPIASQRERLTTPLGCSRYFINFSCEGRPGVLSVFPARD